MARIKYEDVDLKNWCEGLTTLDELSIKYNVDKAHIVRNANRRGYHKVKTKVVIYSPQGNKECESISECAWELGVSYKTVLKALKGERVKLFDELDIVIKKVEK